MNTLLLLSYSGQRPLYWNAASSTVTPLNLRRPPGLHVPHQHQHDVERVLIQVGLRRPDIRRRCSMICMHNYYYYYYYYYYYVLRPIPLLLLLLLLRLLLLPLLLLTNY